MYLPWFKAFQKACKTLHTLTNYFTAIMDCRSDAITGRDLEQLPNNWRASRERNFIQTLEHSAFTDHLKPMVLLSLTGMRRGEIFNLKWPK